MFGSAPIRLPRESIVMSSATEIRCRTFHNVDPPHLTALWRQAGDDRGLVPDLSTMTLESDVLAKPYFDPEGLILAELDNKPVGFVHAGFGPSEQVAHQLDFDLGVICLIVVPRHDQHGDIEDALIEAAEHYLRRRGAKVIYGGQMHPLNPFYFGLYGGSELSGVLGTDTGTHDLLRRCGYEACSHAVLLQRELLGFRPPLDRKFMQHRRQYQVTPALNPQTKDWWQACLHSNLERTRFELIPRCGGPAVGEATYWNMEGVSRARGVATSGLVSVHIPIAVRAQGLGTFLVAESMRQLQELSVKRIATQTLVDNDAARRLYHKLGFTEVDQSTVYRRTA